jgi:hypothetical protein
MKEKNSGSIFLLWKKASKAKQTYTFLLWNYGLISYIG